MILWWVCYNRNEWGSFVIAETRGKAKNRFHKYFSGFYDSDEWIDIRCYKKKIVEGYDECVLDEPDDPILEKLGVRYLSEEEIYEEEFI